MSVLDSGYSHSNLLVDWVSAHGAATALGACLAFWVVLLTSLYLIF